MGGGPVTGLLAVAAGGERAGVVYAQGLNLEALADAYLGDRSGLEEIDADAAVRLLRSRRRRARRFREGHPEWRRASLPVSQRATGVGP